jgi:hypothetical protein
MCIFLFINNRTKWLSHLELSLASLLDTRSLHKSPRLLVLANHMASAPLAAAATVTARAVVERNIPLNTCQSVEPTALVAATAESLIDAAPIDADKYNVHC